MISSTLHALGFLPQHPYSLYFPLSVLAIWLLFYPFAFLGKIRLFYTASLKASFFEEIIFRGLIQGGLALAGFSTLKALLISSLLFGLVHMRIIGWAGWRRAWETTLYAGVVAGPIFGLIRLISGDIYLGILIHFFHNFLIIFAPQGMQQYVAETPTDRELRKGSGN